MTSISPSSTTHYNGSILLDEEGTSIGEVRDVLFEGSSETPSWLVVKPGRLRSEHWVPARGLRRTDGDELLVPYSCERVRSSPKAARNHVLTQQERRALGQHYELAHL